VRDPGSLRPSWNTSSASLCCPCCINLNPKISASRNDCGAADDDDKSSLNPSAANRTRQSIPDDTNVEAFGINDVLDDDSSTGGEEEDGVDGDGDDDDDLKKQRGDVVGTTKLDATSINRRMVRMTYIDTVVFCCRWWWYWWWWCR